MCGKWAANSVRSTYTPPKKINGTLIAQHKFHLYGKLSDRYFFDPLPKNKFTKRSKYLVSWITLGGSVWTPKTGFSHPGGMAPPPSLRHLLCSAPQSEGPIVATAPLPGFFMKGDFPDGSGQSGRPVSDAAAVGLRWPNPGKALRLVTAAKTKPFYDSFLKREKSWSDQGN